MGNADDLDLMVITILILISSNFVVNLLTPLASQQPKSDGRRGKKRKAKPPPDYSGTTWGRMLRETADVMREQPHSSEHKQFRLRFRIPFILFERLVDWTLTWYNATCAHFAANGQKRIPVQLLVLGVLRMLGRGTCLDGINELSGISGTKMSTFFHLWCEHVATDLFFQHVTFPESDGDIRRVLEEFGFVGFPGCIGSMDVVHIPWDMCPASQAVLYKGKDKAPTIAYQVIVDHAGRVLSCTAGFYGSLNDKTIVKFDGVVTRLRMGSHDRVKYTVHDEQGNAKERSGVWVMVDGGYCTWAVTMAASSTNPGKVYSAWRAKLESVRKDIECFFGRLKKRFAILKNALRLHSKKKIDNIFKTCVTLQNMLHDWDGMGFAPEMEEKEVPIEGDDKNHWASIQDSTREGLQLGSKVNNVEFVDCEEDLTEYGLDDLASLRLPEKLRYRQLEDDLVGHFGHLINTNQHKNWLRSRTHATYNNK